MGHDAGRNDLARKIGLTPEEHRHITDMVRARGIIAGAKILRRINRPRFGNPGGAFAACAMVNRLIPPAVDAAMGRNRDARKRLEGRAYALGLHPNYVWNATHAQLRIAVYRLTLTETAREAGEAFARLGITFEQATKALRRYADEIRKAQA